ncbi:MAG: C4-dicarboxylate ABC transporter substrate-binding protein, partial [Pseudomonadota bacterium]
PVNGLTINTDTFNRLPEDVQQIILEVGQGYEDVSGDALDERQAVGLAGLEEEGATIRTLDPTVRSDWAASLAEFPQQQADEADERGMPGTEVIETYLDIVTESGYEWPHEYSLEN